MQKKAFAKQDSEQLERKIFATKDLIYYWRQPCWVRWGFVNLEKQFTFLIWAQASYQCWPTKIFVLKIIYQKSSNMWGGLTVTTKINNIPSSLNHWARSRVTWPFQKWKVVGGEGLQMDDNIVYTVGAHIQWKYYAQVKINEPELHDESHE